MDYFLISLCSLLIGYGAALLFRKASREAGAMGMPQPDHVYCEAGVVKGVIDPDTADPAPGFRAMIFDECPDDDYDPSSLEELQNQATHPQFHLTDVPSEASLTNPVCVVVWTHYSESGNHHFIRGEAELNCLSGSGDAALLAQRSRTVSTQPVVENAPLQCTLDVTGFGPSVLTAFNRVWMLAHRGGGQLLWDNGGDGSETPRVELATERPFGTPWILTFRLGKVMISYTKSAEEWRALADNTFHSVTANGVSDDAILPASVTVIPA